MGLGFDWYKQTIEGLNLVISFLYPLRMVPNLLIKLDLIDILMLFDLIRNLNKKETLLEYKI